MVGALGATGVAWTGCADGVSGNRSPTSDTGLVEPDWVAEIPGLYDGREESPTIGTVTATFEVVYDAEDDHFDVFFAPDGVRRYQKLHFGDVQLADQPNVGLVVVPDQVYAEGQTGPATLRLEGAGTVGPEGRDGRVDLERGRVRLQARIRASGEPEDFTLTLDRQ